MIAIKNIYYMLAYAFRALTARGYRDVGSEEFENIADLFSAILSKGMSIQIKRGLNKEYHVVEGDIATVKGKINVSETVARQTMRTKKVNCSYDELSVDSFLNRVVKTALTYLLKSNASLSWKRTVKKTLVYLTEVSLLDPALIDWNYHYNRSNETYRLLIAVSYLTLKGLLQNQEDGKTKMMDFLDEQKMYHLYERFILEFYRVERPYLFVNASEIRWNLDEAPDEYLPKMKSDIMLRKKNRVLIIDAKYYGGSMQKNYGEYTLRSAHLYQIFTYVKNQQMNEPDHQVVGLLLYAKTDEGVFPNSDYLMSGSRIAAKTLDLEGDFDAIKSSLLQYADEYLRPAQITQ